MGEFRKHKAEKIIREFFKRDSERIFWADTSRLLRTAC